MSLHFNWSRLDETCAEALRQLINKRLAEVVERINAKSAVATNAAHSSSPRSTASQAFSTNETVSKNCAGAATGTIGASAVLPSLVGCSGAGVGNSNNKSSNRNTAVTNSMHPDPLPNVSPRGLPREVCGGLLGVSDLTARSPFLSSSPATNVFPSSGVTSGVTGSANMSIIDIPAGAGGASPLLQQRFNGSNNNSAFGAPSGLRSDTLDVSGIGGLSSDDGGIYATHLTSAGYGNVAVRGGNSSNTNNNNNMSGTASPNSTNVYDLYSTRGNSGTSRSVAAEPTTAGPAAAAAPPTPASMLRETEHSVGTDLSWVDGHQVPPIIYLEVSSVGWGTTPPFVDVVAFENATDGPPGYNLVPQQQQQRSFGAGGGSISTATTGSPRGEVRDTLSYVPSYVTPTDNVMTSSTALIGGGGCYAVAAGSSTSNNIGGDAGADNNSENSHDFTISHSATGANTPLIINNTTAGHLAGVTQQARVPSSLSQFPCQPETTDTLASVLGYGGLHVRFHITYGGALHLSLNTAVQHEVRLGAVTLRVSLPMMFYLANLDLDCYLCINVRNNACQVWLEHGPLSSSVVNRLSITATFGGDDDTDEGGLDYGASSTDFYSRFGSSSVSDDDNGESSNGVYVNEHEVSQFVVHELRAILKETIVAPHCITIPISFGG